MRIRLRVLSLPVALAAGALSYGAHADDPEPAAPVASVSTSGSAPKSLRKPRPEPTVVQVIDLGGDRDPQGFAMSGSIGPGFFFTRGSPGQFGVAMSVAGEFGLGEGSKRVPWTLEPFISFAITYNVLAETRGYPNRFTEVGVRIVRRFDGGALEHQWFSLGAGAVWSSRRPSSGYFHPSHACSRDDKTEANTLGLDCSHDDNISPGLLVDLGAGLYEWTVRRARWGFAARLPLQISSAPGFAAIGVFYAQIGTAL